MNKRKMKGQIQQLLERKPVIRDSCCVLQRLMIDLGFCVGNHNPRLRPLIASALDQLEEEHIVHLERCGKRYLAVELAE